MEDDKQAKLRSVDYLMLILTRLGLCDEVKALSIFQQYRHEIFYKYRNLSRYGGPRCVKVPLK